MLMRTHGGLGELGKGKTTKTRRKPVSTPKAESRLITLRGTATISRTRSAGSAAQQLKQFFVNDGWDLVEFEIVSTRNGFYVTQGECVIKISANLSSKYSADQARQKAIQLIDSYTVWDIVNGSYRVLTDVKLTVSKDSTTQATPTPTKPKDTGGGWFGGGGKKPKDTGGGYHLPSFSIPVANPETSILGTINNGITAYSQTTIAFAVVILILGALGLKWLLKE